MNPLVSVLMPMRNAAPYVREAIESILMETSVPLEVIVIENGSSDDSVEVVSSIEDPRVRLVTSPGSSISGALNFGLGEIRGGIVMRCDADDRYVSGRIARQVEWLNSHPNFGAVCGSYSTIDEPGRLISALETGKTDQEVTEELLEGKTRTHLCTYAIRADLVPEDRPFRPYFQTAEDIDFQLRLGGLTRVWYEARPAYEYRLHDASTIHTQANERRLFFERTARAFATQRRESGSDDLARGYPPLPPIPAGKPQSSGVQRQGMLLGRAWREHALGEKWKAIKTGWRACWTSPGSWRTWKSFVALLLKRPS